MTSHIKNLGKDFLIYGIGASLQMLVGFILLPILTRVFDPSNYGVIDLNSTVIEIYSIVFGLGMTTAVSFFFYHSDDTNDKRVTISTGIIFLFILNIVIGSLIFYNSSQFSQFIFKSTNYSNIFKYTIVISIISIFYSYLLYLYRITRQPIKYITNSIIKMVLDVLFIIFFIKVFKTGINGYFVALISSWIISTAIVIITTRKLLIWSFSKQRLIQLLKYGIPLIPAGIALWALQLINRFFLVRYISLHDVGLYGVGVRSTILVILLVNSLKMAWIPFAFSIMKEANAKEVYAKVLSYFLMLGTWLAVITSLFAKEGISFIATQEYVAAYSVTSFLCFSVLFLGTYTIISIGVILVKKTYILSITTVIAAIANIILNFLLIPPFGIIGAACASAIAYLIATITVYFYNKKYYKIQFELFKNAFTIILGIILIIISLLFSFHENISNITFKIILIIIFPILLVVFRLVNKSELQQLIKLIKVGIFRPGI